MKKNQKDNWLKVRAKGVKCKKHRVRGSEQSESNYEQNLHVPYEVFQSVAENFVKENPNSGVELIQKTGGIIIMKQGISFFHMTAYGGSIFSSKNVEIENGCSDCFEKIEGIHLTKEEYDETNRLIRKHHLGGRSEHVIDWALGLGISEEMINILIDLQTETVKWESVKLAEEKANLLKSKEEHNFDFKAQQQYGDDDVGSSKGTKMFKYSRKR